MCTSIVDLDYEMLSISLELYDNPIVPRNIVQKIITTLINFSTKTLTWVEKKLNEKCQNDISNVLISLKSVMSEADEIFNKYKTERSYDTTS